MLNLGRCATLAIYLFAWVWAEKTGRHCDMNRHHQKQKSRQNNRHASVKKTTKQPARSEKSYIDELDQRVADFDLTQLRSISKFSELPMSSATQEGLKAAYFNELTDIQRQAIVPALQGDDILGAARTGSGKTLAFLLPIIENLYRKQWTPHDGLGALVITPTRELAIQIFQVLKKIGSKHSSMSAGLIIGGKDVKTEADRIGRLNILICTPGRLLQHMDQSVQFDTTNLQMLVLDEADRILDMGFKHTIDSIIENLPKERQTLLFSATQTKSVSDLARLSLSEPKYIAVHEKDATSTPKSLEQFYVTCDVPEKLDTLYAFIKTHLKAKILVFFASSKQVRFAYETFRRLQPGIPLLHLHGKQKQQARMDVVANFSAAQNSCLISTDVVARGIDFPAVDWVIQVDCPEDAATYIHRVGRSARFDKKGHALLCLTPSEEAAMVKELESKKIPISKLVVKETKKKSIQQDLQMLCFKEPEVKYLGQKAFITYLRSVYIQKNKEVFNIENIPMEAFAKSLGLPGTPKVELKGIEKSRELKNMSRQLQRLLKQDDEGNDVETDTKPKTKYDRMFQRQNQDVLSEHYRKVNSSALDDIDGGQNDDDDDDDDEFMKVKHVEQPGGDALNIEDDMDEDLSLVPTSKRAAKKALSKKQAAKAKGNSKKLVFDDEGKAHELYEFGTLDDFAKDGAADIQKKSFVEKESADLAQRDISDKDLAREKRLEKKRKRKEKMLARKGLINEEDDDDEEIVYTVGAGDDDEMLSQSDADEPTAKKPKWFQKDHKPKSRKDVLEVDQPETLEDLEALSTKLLQG